MLKVDAYFLGDVSRDQINDGSIISDDWLGGWYCLFKLSSNLSTQLRLNYWLWKLIAKPVHPYRKLTRDIDLLSFNLTVTDALPKKLTHTLTLHLTMCLCAWSRAPSETTKRVRRKGLWLVQVTRLTGATRLTTESLSYYICNATYSPRLYGRRVKNLCFLLRNESRDVWLWWKFSFSNFW